MQLKKACAPLSPWAPLPVILVYNDPSSERADVVSEVHDGVRFCLFAVQRSVALV